MGKPIDMTGSVVGKLKVIRQVPRKAGCKHFRLMWECLCDCGNTAIIIGKSLRNGTTRSCGCIVSGICRSTHQKPKGVSGFNLLWHRYKRSAVIKGHDFLIDRDIFEKLTKAKCYYCGDPPSTVSAQKGRKITKQGTQHSSYTYNGIDRVDNSKGYVPGNCVACCDYCNWIKSNLTQDAFLSKIKQICSNLGLIVEPRKDR